MWVFLPSHSWIQWGSYMTSKYILFSWNLESFLGLFFGNRGYGGVKRSFFFFSLRENRLVTYRHIPLNLVLCRVSWGLPSGYILGKVSQIVFNEGTSKQQKNSTTTKTEGIFLPLDLLQVRQLAEQEMDKQSNAVELVLLLELGEQYSSMIMVGRGGGNRKSRPVNKARWAFQAQEVEHAKAMRYQRTKVLKNMVVYSHWG